MNKLDGVRIVHFIPGRLRLRLDALRGQAGLAQRIEHELGAVPGVRRVQAKPVSGSLLLEYQRDALHCPESMEAFGEALRRLFPASEAQRLEGWLREAAEHSAGG